MAHKICCLHAPSKEIELVSSPSIYCHPEYVYLVPDEPSLIKWAKTIAEAEKEKSDWIRRYDNVLNGLNYWRSKALEK